MSDKANFLRDMDAAGYIEEHPEDILVVKELPDRYVFIVREVWIGEYTLGEFFKETSTSSADFAGMPLAICKDYDEAVKNMNEFLETITS